MYLNFRYESNKIIKSQTKQNEILSSIGFYWKFFTNSPIFFGTLQKYSVLSRQKQMRQLFFLLPLLLKISRKSVYEFKYAFFSYIKTLYVSTWCIHTFNKNRNEFGYCTRRRRFALLLRYTLIRMLAEVSTFFVQSTRIDQLIVFFKKKTALCVPLVSLKSAEYMAVDFCPLNCNDQSTNERKSRKNGFSCSVNTVSYIYIDGDWSGFFIIFT